MGDMLQKHGKLYKYNITVKLQFVSLCRMCQSEVLRLQATVRGLKMTAYLEYSSNSRRIKAIGPLKDQKKGSLMGQTGPAAATPLTYLACTKVLNNLNKLLTHLPRTTAYPCLEGNKSHLA